MVRRLCLQTINLTIGASALFQFLLEGAARTYACFRTVSFLFFQCSSCQGCSGEKSARFLFDCRTLLLDGYLGTVKNWQTSLT